MGKNPAQKQVALPRTMGRAALAARLPHKRFETTPLTMLLGVGDGADK